MHVGRIKAAALHSPPKPRRWLVHVVPGRVPESLIKVPDGRKLIIAAIFPQSACLPTYLQPNKKLVLQVKAGPRSWRNKKLAVDLQ